MRRRAMLRACLILLMLSSVPAMVTGQTLASGSFDLGASTGPGHPDFNSALTANHSMPIDVTAGAGAEVRVSLRDVSRPDKVCDLEDDFGDLFNGCAAVDWPFASRRGINLLEVQTTEGLTTLHLRIGDTLSSQAEPEGP